MRNILLIEPNYKNKYPPIGLMKLATYHRLLGDNVRFYKGDLKEFVLDEIVTDAIVMLKQFSPCINWIERKSLIRDYIKTKKQYHYTELLVDVTENKPIIDNWFKHFLTEYRSKGYKKNPKWDRICITTLFTFHWNITINTINFAKDLIKDTSQLFVGGVLATILHDEVYKETGIKTHKGLLDTKGILDGNEYIIDNLPLDYSILYETDYKYPEDSGYYGYMTRGCKRKCDFCAVWRLEPEFKGYLPLKNAIKNVIDIYGEKRNLLLLDNNVLASPKFDKIIDEIKSLGFKKGAKFVMPNDYDIAVKNLISGHNNHGYSKQIICLLNGLLNKARGEDKQIIFDILVEYRLLHFEFATRENIIKSHILLSDYYEKYRNKSPKLRYIDFNQGVDARFMTEKKMQRLGEISIRPLRIAFDSMKFKKQYEQAVRWAAKYDIKELSNYLLYNFDDEPIDLYRRLELNIMLCEELNIPIFSFPMKYLPIDDKDKMQYYKHRNYIGEHWNRKYLRAVQAILNSTKGKIGRGEAFFRKAFGKDEQEYFELLLMPETYLIFRYFFEDNGMIAQWKKDLYTLTESEKTQALDFILTNKPNEQLNCQSIKIKNFLKHYTTTNRDDVMNPKSKLGQDYAAFKKTSKKDDAVAEYKKLYNDKLTGKSSL